MVLGAQGKWVEHQGARTGRCQGAMTPITFPALWASNGKRGWRDASRGARHLRQDAV